MNYLAVLRHASYGPDGRINDTGRVQMATVGSKLKRLRDNSAASLVLLSSTAPRALDSADILASILQVDVHAHEVLWSDSKHAQHNEHALTIVQSEVEYDIVVMVTHLEYCVEFPDYFSSRVLGRNVSTLGRSTYGSTQVIDCVNGKDIWLNP